MNGLEVVTHMKDFYEKQKAVAATKGIALQDPIYIFLSAFGQQGEFKAHCLSKGVNYVYDKPLNPIQVREMLGLLT